MVTVSGTKMDITIQLKSGLKWSDGTTITTQDIKCTWQQMCNPDSGAITAPGFDQVQDMQILSPTKMVWQMGPVPAGHCQAPTRSTPASSVPTCWTWTCRAAPAHPGLDPRRQLEERLLLHQLPDLTDGPYKVTSFTGGNNTVVTYKPNPYYADGRSGAKYFNHKAVSEAGSSTRPTVTSRASSPASAPATPRSVRTCSALTSRRPRT